MANIDISRNSADKTLESKFTPEELELIRKERAAYQREWRQRMTPEERSIKDAQKVLNRAKRKAAQSSSAEQSTGPAAAQKPRWTRKDRVSKALESHFTPEELELIRQERAATQRAWRAKMTPEERRERNAQYLLAAAKRKAAAQSPGTDPDGQTQSPL